ncbi:MAG TPA: hypothetical protein DD379_22240, partial [Cyanobacteria bacterium UBA11162]|nr:hypothetical protein [Cyanobacteria bacterium UBA11162]
MISPYSKQQPTTNNQQQCQEAIREYADRINGLLSNVDITPEQWQQFGDVLVALDAVGYKGLKLLGADCFYCAKNYQQAVNNWEADNVAKKSEYYQAKAKIVGMPDGLEYLAQAGDYDGIIGEWVQAGKPRERGWLNYVAVALETKHYYQQAFVIYVWLDELAKVKECFELARESTSSIKLITVLFQYFFRKKY